MHSQRFFIIARITVFDRRKTMINCFDNIVPLIIFHLHQQIITSAIPALLTVISTSPNSCANIFQNRSNRMQDSSSHISNIKTFPLAPQIARHVLRTISLVVPDNFTSAAGNESPLAPAAYATASQLFSHQRNLSFKAHGFPLYCVVPQTAPPARSAPTLSGCRQYVSSDQ